MQPIWSLVFCALTAVAVSGCQSEQQSIEINSELSIDRCAQLSRSDLDKLSPNVSAFFEREVGVPVTNVAVIDGLDCDENYIVTLTADNGDGLLRWYVHKSKDSEQMWLGRPE